MKKSRKLIASLSMAGVLLAGSAVGASAADAQFDRNVDRPVLVENYIKTDVPIIRLNPTIPDRVLKIDGCTPRFAILGFC